MVGGGDGLAYILQFDRWTGQAKYKNLGYELVKSQGGERVEFDSKWVVVTEYKYKY